MLATPDPRAHDVFAAYETTLSNVLRASGNDPTWCRRVHGAMRDVGLTDVDTEGWQRSWAGGTGVCLLAYSGSKQLHDKLVGAGMAADDLEDVAPARARPAPRPARHAAAVHHRPQAALAR